MSRPTTNEETAHMWANGAPDPSGFPAALSYEGRSLYSYSTVIAFRLDNAVLMTSTRYSATTSCRHMPAARSATRHLTSVEIPDLNWYSAALEDLFSTRGTSQNNLDLILVLCKIIAKKNQTVSQSLFKKAFPRRKFSTQLARWEKEDVKREKKEAREKLELSLKRARHFIKGGFSYHTVSLAPTKEFVKANFSKRDYKKFCENTLAARRKIAKNRRQYERAKQRRSFSNSKALLRSDPDKMLAEIAQRQSVPNTPVLAELESVAYNPRVPKRIQDIAKTVAGYLWYVNWGIKDYQNRKRAAADAEELEKWREGDRRIWRALRLPDGSAALRINGDKLETSEHATVPLDHAIKIFKRIMKIRGKISERYEVPEKSPWRVGYYRVNWVDPDGSFKAGCHLIKWPEIERAAKSLNLL